MSFPEMLQVDKIQQKAK